MNQTVLEENPVGEFGKIIILNGVPRSGKSQIATTIQKTFDGIWMNIGVDHYMKMMPPQVFPGIGLRPGQERPDMEEMIRGMYHALYDTIAAHARRGFHVVADLGQHDDYKTIDPLLPSCLKLLEGLPVYLVGVTCSLDELVRRRQETGYPCFNEDGTVIQPVLRWQETIHRNKSYDFMVDTTSHTSEECAAQIKRLIDATDKLTAWSK